MDKGESKSERTDTSGSYSIMPSHEFNKIILPEGMNDPIGAPPSKLLLCPEEFKEQI